MKKSANMFLVSISSAVALALAYILAQRNFVLAQDQATQIFKCPRRNTNTRPRRFTSKRDQSSTQNYRHRPWSRFQNCACPGGRPTEQQPWASFWFATRLLAAQEGRDNNNWIHGTNPRHLRVQVAHLRARSQRNARPNHCRSAGFLALSARGNQPQSGKH